MPIYEYRCQECHQVFEEWAKSADDMEIPGCPVCDSPAERIISNTTFVLKGSGWYATDHAHKDKAPAAETVSADEPSAPPVAAAAPAPAAAAGAT